MEPGARNNRLSPAICLLLAGVTLAVFWPATQNGFVGYDDNDYVTNNSQVQGGLTWETVAWAFRTGHAANWHPFTWLSHLLDVTLFGLDPAGHHLTSVLLHAANASLLFLLLRQLTGSVWRSAFVAALFALHPLRVESVAWVSERKDVLSMFFALLSLMAYAAYTRRDKLRWQQRLPRYLLALGLFAAGLMSKPMLVTLPFLMLLLDRWPLNRLRLDPPNWRRLAGLTLEKAPFLVLAAASCAATLAVQEPARMRFGNLPLELRAANAVVSVPRYLGKFLWPDDLAVLYPHPIHWPVVAVAASALLVAVLTILAVLSVRSRPSVFVGWAWFLGTMVPVLGLVQVGVQSMADRYTYLPMIGIHIALAWGAGEWFARLNRARWVAAIAAAAILAACVPATRSQVRLWRDTETLFTHTAAVTRNNWVANYNLALLAITRYQTLERGAVDRQLLETDAPTGAPQDYLAETIRRCEATIQADPKFADAYFTLAKALTESGRLAEALGQLKTGLRLNSSNPEAWQNVAEIHHRQGRAGEAVHAYKTALGLKPDWEPVMNNLAWLLATHPRDDVRDGEEALRLATRANNLTGRTNVWFLQTLAAAQAESGRFPDAIETVHRSSLLAAEAGLTSVVARSDARLKLYQSSQPLRD